MRNTFAPILSAAAIALILALGGTNSASAQSVMKQCGDQWKAAKAASTTNGQTWQQFLKDCRAKLSSATNAPSQGSFAPATPAPAPAPAPTQSGSLFPWQQPTAPAPAPTPSSYGTRTPNGAGQFASPQEAQSRCPGATVVWVNQRSHIYHFAGTRDYGHTKQGAYMCEADAQSAGNRAAKNEQHP
jgi:hypothetical protein